MRNVRLIKQGEQFLLLSGDLKKKCILVCKQLQFFMWC